MHLPILIEPLSEGSGFSARMGEPFNLSATGATAAEAFAQLQSAFQRRLDAGAQVAALRAPAPSLLPPNPGWLPDDDMTREWLEAIEEYRRECDAADRQRILGETDDDKVAS